MINRQRFLIDRREFGGWVAGSLGAAMLPRRAVAAEWAPFRDEIIIDGQSGPGDPVESDPLAPLNERAVADARQSGVTATLFTFAQPGDSFEQTVRGLAAIEEECQRYPDLFLKVLRTADIRTAKSTHRVGLIYELQDATFAADDPSRVDVLFRLGLRVLQPTYNLRGVFGDGCLEPGNAGLSKQGHTLINQLNKNRILVDLSHCGQRTTAEGIAASAAPLALTHTGCAAVYAHPRNKRDEELRACAHRGGVVGIYFMPYLHPQPMLEHVVRHVEHALDVCGEDHVGIGTDNEFSALVITDAMRKTAKEIFERRRRAGIAAPDESADFFPYVPDLTGPRKLEVLASALAARKHPARRIAKILGGNFHRLLGEVWGG
jgi:membrane dipeptidase